MNQAMFSSATDNWATPQDFFDELNREFGFTLDPCADVDNAKCERFFSREQDGLAQSWGGGDGFLQSSLRQRDREVGQEGA